MAHGGGYRLLCAICLLVLSGCGGDTAPADDSSASDPGPQGYYAGFLISDVTGWSWPVAALVTDDGEVRIVGMLDGRQFLAAWSATDAGWQSGLTGFAGPVADFPDHTPHCRGSIQGGAFAEVELVGAYSCGGDHGSFDLIFDDTVSFDPPDVGELAGVAEQDSATGNITLLSIAPDGSFTGSDTQGCSYSGRFRAADPIINLYDMQLHLSCGGQASELTGTASLVQTDTTASLHYGASDASHSRAGVLLFQ